MIAGIIENDLNNRLMRDVDEIPSSPDVAEILKRVDSLKGALEDIINQIFAYEIKNFRYELDINKFKNVLYAS